MTKEPRSSDLRKQQNQSRVFTARKGQSGNTSQRRKRTSNRGKSKERRMELYSSSVFSRRFGFADVSRNNLGCLLRRLEVWNPEGCCYRKTFQFLIGGRGYERR